MIRIKLIENNNRIKNPIVGATLLSKQEYKKYKNHIPYAFKLWWLRSPGINRDQANCCYYGGDVDDYDVDITSLLIRPALILNFQSFNFNIGDKFKFGNHLFITISNNLAICNDFIGEGCFRKDSEVPDANVYKKSDVKKIVDEWFNNSIQKEPNFFNKKNIDFMLQNNDNPELKAQLLQINHDLGQDKREEDDLSWLDMSDEEFKKYMDEHPDEF